MQLVSVTKHIDFDAAHVLPEGYDGKCRNLHGHTYKAYVTVTGPRNEMEFGMVVDFKKLKEAMKEVLPDHMFLCYKGDQKNLDYKEVAEKYDNKIMMFEEPTTAEYMVTVFPDLIENYMHNELGVSKNVQITKMVLYETADSYAEYNKNYIIVENDEVVGSRVEKYEQLSLFD